MLPLAHLTPGDAVALLAVLALAFAAGIAVAARWLAGRAPERRDPR